MPQIKRSKISDDEIFHRCKIKIHEAEISLLDAQNAETFLQFRKDISYGFWSLASALNMLFSDAKFTQSKWVKSNY